MVYEPQEDSFLLAKAVKKFAKGKVLDVGTGSGYQAVVAAQKKNVRSVLAVDIDPEAVAYCKGLKHRKIRCKLSDLFSKVKGKFDTVIFNPPYLPQEGRVRDIQLEGGKQGFEVLAGFLRQVSEYLTVDGQLLILFSSLTNPKVVQCVLEEQQLEWKEVGRQKLFFETLFVYRVRKSALGRKLGKFDNLQFLAHGKRGLVYTADYKGSKVAIKVQRKSTEAIDVVKKEASMLKRVNKADIGPKFIMSGKGFLVYEFVEGIYFKDWLKTANKEEKKRVLLEFLDQAIRLDKLGIAKEEMLRPLKNAIVSKDKLVLIDFERAHPTKRPNNVTQALQFISSFMKDKTVCRKLAQEYSKSRSPFIFSKVKACFD